MRRNVFTTSLRNMVRAARTLLYKVRPLAAVSTVPPEAIAKPPGFPNATNRSLLTPLISAGTQTAKRCRDAAYPHPPKDGGGAHIRTRPNWAPNFATEITTPRGTSFVHNATPRPSDALRHLRTPRSTPGTDKNRQSQKGSDSAHGGGGGGFNDWGAAHWGSILLFRESPAPLWLFRTPGPPRQRPGALPDAPLRRDVPPTRQLVRSVNLHDHITNSAHGATRR